MMADIGHPLNNSVSGVGVQPWLACPHAGCGRV